MRKCVDSGAIEGCPHPRQAGALAPDLVLRLVRKAFERGERLVVIPYPVSSAFFSSIGFRLIDKGPEMVLDHDDLRGILSGMQAMVGEERDLTPWDILGDYMEELALRGPVLVWPSEGLSESIRALEG